MFNALFVNRKFVHSSLAWDSVMKPRVFAVAVALASSSLIACNRTESERDAERAAEQVKVAAETAGEKLADSWLTTKIQAQFFADEDIKSRYINVTTRDGMVFLKGFVESDDVRRQVIEITRNTDGVKQVDDRQLLIGRPAAEFDVIAAAPPPLDSVGTTGVTAPPPAPALDDATVTSLVQANYFRDPAIKARTIDVQAVNGVVTLRGQVASESERAQALSLARSAAGVQRVEDHLTVDAALGPASPQSSASPQTPASPSAVAAPDAAPGGQSAEATPTQQSDKAIVSALESKFAADPRAKGATITVSARNGVVVLEGTAPTQAVKQRALTLAKEAEGVMQVIDRITVRAKA